MTEAIAVIPPWIHLPLDERYQDSMRDTSGHRRNAKIVGDAHVVTDPVFGQCLELRGGTLTLPLLNADEFAEGFTLLLWVQHRADGTEGNVAKFGSLGQSLYSQGGRLNVYGQSISARVGLWDCVALTIAVEAGHVVVKLRGETDAANAMGRSMHPLSLLFGDTSALEDSAKTHSLILGYTPYDGAPVPHDNIHSLPIPEAEKGFCGRLAHLRIYPRALSVEEIDAIRKADRAIDDAAWRGPPISMSLENDDGLPELYIDAGAKGQTMNLHVNRNTRANVGLAAGQGLATARNWHLCVAFRPGVLRNLSAIGLGAPGWSLATASTDDGDTVYLLSNEACELPLSLPLTGLFAASEQGTRTTRAKFYYQNLTGDPIGPRSGYVSQQLQLIHHGGQRTIPLYVGISGPNKIKIGSSADLCIRLTNILPEIAEYGRSNDLVFDPYAHILLSFDQRDGTDWALAHSDLIKNIEIRYGTKGITDRIAVLEGTGDSTQSKWRLDLQDIVLAPLERIEIILNKVPAQGEAGHSNVYLDLVDVPGYWNARFTCAIEKVALSTAAWQPLELNQPYWKSSSGAAPEYYKDAFGVVHLRGRCWLLGKEMYESIIAQGYLVHEDNEVHKRWWGFIKSIENFIFNRQMTLGTAPRTVIWNFQEPIPDPFSLPANCAPEKEMRIKHLTQYRKELVLQSGAENPISAPVAGVNIIRDTHFSIQLWGQNNYYPDNFTWQSLLTFGSPLREWNGLAPVDFVGPMDWHIEICLDGFSYVAGGV